MRLCPKCYRYTNTTTHYYHDNEGRALKYEVVCDSCHQIIEIHHTPRKEQDAKPR